MPGMLYRDYLKDTESIKRNLNRESKSPARLGKEEGIASGKDVSGKRESKVSRTANVCTEEHEPYKRDGLKGKGEIRDKV